MNATNAELEASSDSCELWGWGCGGLIVLGVIAEVVIAAINPPYGSFWERWGTVVADALVAFGVGGEIMFSRIGHSRQKELSRRSNEDVAQLAFESGYAEERAAKLEKEAAEAKRETERLKKEVAWRALEPRTARKLIAELSKIPSRVTLVFVSGDPETTAFCAQFVEVFRRANWQVEVAGRTFLGPPVGIFITHGDTWSAAIQIEIDRLRKAFVDAGIPVENGGGAVDARGTGFRIATAEVRAIIGHRPAPKIE
jgi:hypothetical protein